MLIGGMAAVLTILIIFIVFLEIEIKRKRQEIERLINYIDESIGKIEKDLEGLKK